VVAQLFVQVVLPDGHAATQLSSDWHAELFTQFVSWVQHMLSMQREQAVAVDEGVQVGPPPVPPVPVPPVPAVPVPPLLQLALH
jgi:hypothetical protein